VRTYIALSVKGLGATDSAAPSAWPIAERADVEVGDCVSGCWMTVENGPCRSEPHVIDQQQITRALASQACVSQCMAVPPFYAERHLTRVNRLCFRRTRNPCRVALSGHARWTCVHLCACCNVFTADAMCFDCMYVLKCNVTWPCACECSACVGVQGIEWPACTC
jgi:hypothetical protein